jgi:hypothetical protein
MSNFSALLRVFLVGEVPAGKSKLARGDEAGLACLQHHGEPAVLRLRAPPQLEERIAALGRADEHRPASARSAKVDTGFASDRALTF